VPATTAAIEQRHRVFTMLFRVYQEVRAAVTFLRRQQGDALLIAPSLYQPRKRRPASE
jgi:hypothetical protein